MKSAVCEIVHIEQDNENYYIFTRLWNNNLLKFKNNLVLNFCTSELKNLKELVMLYNVDVHYT